jgi:hypothetical protein
VPLMMTPKQETVQPDNTMAGARASPHPIQAVSQRPQTMHPRITAIIVHHLHTCYAGQGQFAAHRWQLVGRCTQSLRRCRQPSPWRCICIAITVSAIMGACGRAGSGSTRSTQPSALAGGVLPPCIGHSAQPIRLKSVHPPAHTCACSKSTSEIIIAIVVTRTPDVNKQHVSDSPLVHQLHIIPAVTCLQPAAH